MRSIPKTFPTLWMMHLAGLEVNPALDWQLMTSAWRENANSYQHVAVTNIPHSQNDTFT